MPPRDVALLGVLGLASALLGVAAARARDLPGVLLRLLTLPVWLVGAAVIVVGGLALAVPAVLVGRAPALVRSAALTVAGLVEVALPPRPDTSPTGDDRARWGSRGRGRLHRRGPRMAVQEGRSVEDHRRGCGQVRVDDRAAHRPGRVRGRGR